MKSRKMRVFKFGGASVKDADAVKNAAAIARQQGSEKLVIVVSAMGKMTNALEKLTDSYCNKQDNVLSVLQEIKDFHFDILNSLFPDKTHEVYNEVNNLFVELDWVLEDDPVKDYDFEYDQIVSLGELFSTKIVSAYMNDAGVKNKWVDVRDFLKTDNTYREAKINWEETGKCIKTTLYEWLENHGIVVTQGFIGCTTENFTTTLGREGSDYTAAIIAYLLDAQDVTIWKDVAGVLNADPKWFDKTQKLNHISYYEAIELSYYGATIIHPKTIKPLQNKHIPLMVKSFYEPSSEGTLISGDTSSDSLIPSFIFKIDQVLISLSPRDFSLIVEEHLSEIFGCFAKHRVKINMTQNSAISFSACVNNDKERLPKLIESLKKDYKVLFNDNLELITVRHFNQPTIDRVIAGKNILVEQKSRHNARFVVSSSV